MATRWKCLVCGWTSDFESDDPPAVCPVCGATDPEDFEPLTE